MSKLRLTIDVIVARGLPTHSQSTLVLPVCHFVEYLPATLETFFSVDFGELSIFSFSYYPPYVLLFWCMADNSNICVENATFMLQLMHPPRVLVRFFIHKWHVRLHINIEKVYCSPITRSIHKYCGHYNFVMWPTQNCSCFSWETLLSVHVESFRYETSYIKQQELRY